MKGMPDIFIPTATRRQDPLTLNAKTLTVSRLQIFCSTPTASTRSFYPFPPTWLSFFPYQHHNTLPVHDGHADLMLLVQAIAEQPSSCLLEYATNAQNMTHHPRHALPHASCRPACERDTNHAIHTTTCKLTTPSTISDNTSICDSA